MRRLPFIGALVSAVAGMFKHPPARRTVDMGPLDAPEQRPAFRRRRGGGGKGWTRRLLAKQARARLQRYGYAIGEDGRPIRPDSETRRAFARARKQERQKEAAARTPRGRWLRNVRRYIAAKYGVPNPGPRPAPCSAWWRLKTNGARRKHLAGARGCERCRAAVRAEIKARGL
jgi:hypothetical protein